MKGLNGVKYLLLVALLIFFTVGCSSGGGDDGIDGTGMRGTAAEGEPLANAEVIIRDVNGNTRSATTNAEGKYVFNNVNGMTAPFIIKVRKDSTQALYSILPSVNQNRMNIANIHPVSDVAARNWFTSKGRDIESEFDASGDLTNPPTEDDVNALRDALTGLLRFAYADFSIDANFDFIRNDFTANGIGFDGLLDNATIVIKENKVTIKIKDPDTGFEGKIIVKFEMINDLSQADSTPPSEPTGLLVVPASSSEMVVVWDASTDNIGVAGYNVYWGADATVSEGSTTVPYPVFKHEGLSAAQTLCYAVEAVDGAGNVSSRTIVNPSTHCKQTQPDDGNPPDAPTNLQVSDSGLGSVNLTWDAPAINTDIIGYRIYRSAAGDMEVLHAATLLTSFEDVDVVDGVEYCYSVAAVDAAFQESAKTTPDSNSCATVNAASAIPPVSSAAPAGGAYNSTQSVTLSCVASGGLACSIYYTTDGSDPVPQASPLYTAPITVNSDATIKFIARDESGNNELVIHTEQYVIDTVAPTTTATPAAGTFPSPGVSVSLNCSDGSGSGCQTTYYTTDGSVPTTSSNVYSQAVNLVATTTLRYFSIDNAGNPEAPAASVYTIVPAADTTPPVNGTGANFINGGALSTIDASSVSIDIAATDNVAVTQYCAMDNSTGVVPTPEPACWVPVTPAASYSATVTYNLTDTYQYNDNIHVYVWFKDAADNNNVNDVAHDQILYIDPNSPAPVNNTQANFINWGATSTSNISVMLSIAGADISGDLIAYLVQDTTSPTTPTAPSPDDARWVQIPLGASFVADVPYMFTGRPVNGDTLYAHVWFKDALGSVSDAVTDDIGFTSNVIFSENFENGTGFWSISNGIWQFGVPTSGPGAAYSGNNVGATVLDGNYPDWTNSRMESPPIQVPALGAGEEITLRFWQWIAIQTSDRGYVQVSEEVSPGVWSAWTTVSTQWYTSGPWTNNLVDLTAYENKRIKIGFLLSQNQTYGGVAPGWYVDDISLTIGPARTVTLLSGDTYVADFESGLGEWSASNGIWEVGIPTAGPADCNGSTRCAGTVLNGNYPDWTDSRIVSPPIALPVLAPGEDITLRFWQWIAIQTSDRGYVQISQETSPGVWGGWTTISTQWYTSGPWTNNLLDLSAYQGSRIRIAFSLEQNQTYGGNAAGWFVDDVTVTVGPTRTVTLLSGDTYVADFESGLGEWSASNGIWEVGIPTAGPADCNGSTRCAGTVLSGNYPDWTDSRIVSPPIALPVLAPGEDITLRFWQWIAIQTSDRGYVQISQETSPGVWGGWTTISTQWYTSGPWTNNLLDLSAYQGSRIRIAFSLEQNQTYGGNAAGWFVDDVTVSVGPTRTVSLNFNGPFLVDFESGMGEWSASNGIWEVGLPTAGPGDCNGSTQCAGTVLNGNYPDWTDSRFISQPIELPAVSAGQELYLQFQHWFSIQASDRGYVQISQETSPVVWGAWETVNTIANSSGGWTTSPLISLTLYANSKVRIGFVLSQNQTYGGIAAGWYIDDITMLYFTP